MRHQSRKNKRISLMMIVAIILSLVALSGFGAAAFFYRSYLTIKNNPQTEVRNATNQLVAEVGQLMVLPDEEPTVATVTDPSQLQNQEFFSKAKKGDRVLIFPRTRRAVLYDPIAKKIIEVAPVNLGSEPGIEAANLSDTENTQQ